MRRGLGESVERFGERLIHAFVESNHFVDFRGPQPRRRQQPQSNHGCSQRPKLGGGLSDVETRVGTQLAVRFSSGIRRADGSQSKALRLLRLLQVGLGLLHVLRDGGQHLGRVIPQGHGVQARSRRQQSAGERFALCQDCFFVRDNEVRKPHASRLVELPRSRCIRLCRRSRQEPTQPVDDSSRVCRLQDHLREADIARRHPQERGVATHCQ